MSLVKKFSHGLIWNQFAKIAEFGLAFILSFILARGFGPKVYGLYAAVITLTTLVIFISGMGFDEVLNTYIAKFNAQNEKSKAYYLFSKLLIGRFLVSVICGLIVFFSSDLIAKLFGLPEAAKYFRLIIFYLVSLSASNLMVMYFMGSMRVKLIALTKVFAAVTTLVFSYFSLKSGYGIIGQIVVITVVSFVAFSIYLVFSGPDLFKQKEKFDITPMLKFGYPVWGISFLSYALGKQMDIMLIGYFLHSAKQIGFYNIAYGLQLMIASLLLAGTEGVSLAAFSEIETSKNMERTGKAWSLHLKMDQFFLLTMMLFAGWFARPIITVIYSKVYSPSVVFFQIFIVLGLVARAAGGGTNIGLLYALNKEKIVLATRSIGAILNIILDIILIPRYGAIGAVIATGSVGVVLVLTEMTILRRYIKTKFPLAFALKIFLAGAFGIFIASLIKPINGIQLCFAALIYFVIFVIGILILKPFSKDDKEVLSKIHPVVEMVVKYF